MHLLGEVIEREVGELHRQGLRVVHLGSVEELDADLRKRITDAIAFNYGARAEIVRALRRIVEAGIPAGQIDEALVASYLDTAGLPEPDLVIRTAGEMRLSNFLLWQAAYAEFYSTPTLWPDFGPNDVDEALEEYRRRRRRFGGLHPSEMGGAVPAVSEA